MVTDVAVNNTRLIPKDVLTSAAVQSNLLGQESNQERLSLCGDLLNDWYKRQGYVLCSVKTVDIYGNGAVLFQVNEPTVSSHEPLKITFIKRANVTDPDSDFIRATDGKTHPTTVMKALGIRKGAVPKLDAERFDRFRRSGLYDLVSLEGASLCEEDGGATLQMVLAERKSIIIEPAITKPIFDSKWAGSLNIEDRNLFGRNFMVGCNLRRTLQCPCTSFTLRTSNDRFGQLGGWNFGLFREVITGSNHAGRDFTAGDIGDMALDPVAGPGSGRELGMLVRSLKGAGMGKDGAAEKQERLAVTRGINCRTQWPFKVVTAGLGAGYQQVSPLTTRTGPAQEFVQLIGQLTRGYRLPFFPSSCGATGQSNLNVMQGYLLEGYAASRPFRQITNAAVQLIPTRVGNATLALREKLVQSTDSTPAVHGMSVGGQHTVRGCNEGELGKARNALLATGEVRVPLQSDILGLKAAACVFFDVAWFEEMAWVVGGASSSSRAARVRGGLSDGSSGDGDVSSGSSSGDDMAADQETAGTTEAEAGDGPGSAIGASSGNRLHVGHGIGIRLGEMFQLDVGISREGIKQVHLGLCDPFFR
ncbi:unnamed protein product [Chrysoparadoxa australica]